jgi:soluble lytic murein transglycosylase
VKKLIVVGIVFTAMVAVGFAHWKTIRYDSLIEKYSARYRLDFYLVKALIHEESRFNPKAVGPKGELGLMQIMPGVGQEFWERTNRTPYNPKRLLTPEHNIEVGCWYLRESFDMYRDSEDTLICGLARYNAGQTRVARWMTTKNPETRFIDSIDIRATRDYVTRVVNRARRRSQNNLW